jgi:putative acyl-CoA dehydrogenase
MHAQIEYGLCPATMTQATIPLLQKEPALWEALREKLFSDRYDPADVPVAKKSSPPPPPELYGCQAKSWELRA